MTAAAGNSAICRCGGKCLSIFDRILSAGTVEWVTAVATGAPDAESQALSSDFVSSYLHVWSENDDSPAPSKLGFCLDDG